MVPETRTKTVTYTVCKPVYETKTCNYQVCVPVYKDVATTGLSGFAIPTKTVQTGKPMNATPMPPTS